MCLFGEEEINLRERLRAGDSKEAIGSTIQSALQGKKAVLGGHNNMHNIAQGKNRPMILIGG